MDIKLSQKAHSFEVLIKIIIKNLADRYPTDLTISDLVEDITQLEPGWVAKVCKDLNLNPEESLEDFLSQNK